MFAPLFLQILSPRVVTSQPKPKVICYVGLVGTPAHICHLVMVSLMLIQYFTFNFKFTLCFVISWMIRYLLTSLIQNVVPRAKISHTNLSWLFYGKIRNLLSSLFSVMLSFAFVRKYCPSMNKKLKCLILRTVFAEKILRC